MRTRLIAATCLIGAWVNSSSAGTPLHEQIDSAIRLAHAGDFAEPASDAEFLRRAWLDLAGTIPTATQVREFLKDPAPDKRAGCIDRLLGGDDFPRRMQQAFSVMLLERRTGRTVPVADWQEYLRSSFANNKPLDQLVRELISADGTDPATRPAMKFFLARSANKHRLLARDVSRLFLGRNLECAQCHDHPSIGDYRQADFFGIVAFLDRSYLYRDKKTNEQFFVEKGTGAPVEFTSVFTAESGRTGPRLPGGMELVIPMPEKGEELASAAAEGKPPLAKFSLRPQLAEQLTGPGKGEFAKTMANRLWALMMGRGLVHPLDMRHSDNPPSHPELLDTLADSLIASGFDVKHFLREIALSDAYQRSSRLPDNGQPPEPQTYAAFNLRPLSAEQLAYSVMQATGSLEDVLAVPADPAATAKYRPDKGRPIPAVNLDNVLKLFRAVYAGQPGTPEDGFNPSLEAALFLENEALLLDWLKPKQNNLMARLSKAGDDGVADELYLSVLSREPSDDERQAVADYLLSNPDGRQTALREMAWALLASSEFRLNH